MNLTRQQITEIANSIGLSYPVFAAFIEVESGGRGFDPKTGKLIIQFEPHVFARYLTQFNLPHELTSTYIDGRKMYKITCQGRTIINGVLGQQAEWTAFNTAMQIHPKAAMLSTSIGMSQVMGFNYSKLGYDSVSAMWDDFKTGEYAQVKGMATFIKNTRGMLEALTTEDWKTAAKLYNGAGYAVNQYHIKLENAFNKYSA